jgi:hypothetical protein
MVSNFQVSTSFSSLNSSVLFCEAVSRGIRGSVVGSGTMLQAGKSRVRFAMMLLDYSINLILPAAEMSARNLPGGKGQPTR